MNCDLFIEKLPEMMGNELSEQDRQQMFEHMKYCKCCRNEFQLMTKFRDELRQTFIDNDFKYKSQKNAIINRIDKNKYKKSKIKLIYKVSIGVVAASILAFIGWGSINKILFNKQNLDSKNIDTISAKDARHFSAVKNDPVLNNLKIVEAKKVDNGIKPQIRALSLDNSIKDKIKKKGDSLLPLKDIILEEGKRWVGPPRVEYINDNIMVFTVANFIGAYSFTEHAYYSIIDIRALNVGWYQGSQVYKVEYINDRTIVVGTIGDYESENKPIYIVDLVEERAVEVKDFSLNRSKLKVDAISNNIIISKGDFSKVIRVDYKNGEYTEVSDTIETAYNYSKCELDRSEFIKESIYKDKEMYPGLKKDDKLIELYNNHLFVQRGDSVYVISKDVDKLLVETIGKVKEINSNNYDEKVIIEKEKETIVINKRTLEIFKYKNDANKTFNIKYSPLGNYRIVYGDNVMVQSSSGISKEVNELKDYVLESKITDDGKVIYLTLNEELGVKINTIEFK